MYGGLQENLLRYNKIVAITAENALRKRKSKASRSEKMVSSANGGRQQGSRLYVQTSCEFNAIGEMFSEPLPISGLGP